MKVVVDKMIMKVVANKLITMEGDTALIKLRNSSGASVFLSSLGAGIVAVNVPDGAGSFFNVVTGYRHAVDAVIWDHEIINDNEVMFCTPSRTLSYRWTEDNVLEIYFHPKYSISNGFNRATCLRSSQAESGFTDILRQTYFNLDSSRDALPDEYLWLNSSDHPDFSVATVIRTRLKDSGIFDHQYRIRDWQADVMNDAVVLASHLSGHQLSIHTSFPAIRIAIPRSCDGISFSTNALAESLSAPQTTFLHFSLLDKQSIKSEEVQHFSI